MIAHPYVEAAVTRELEALRGTAEGGRAQAAFKAAAALGGLVGAGALGQDEAEALLLETALATGLPESEAGSHVRRGLQAGMATPRDLPASVLQSPQAPPRAACRPTTPRPPKSPRRPPLAEVEAVWGLARPVASEDEATRYLRSRGLDPAAVEDWDLARVIAPDAALPGWAWTQRGGRWIDSGHRLVFQVWGAGGANESLRARQITGRKDLPKSLAPAGCSPRGLVLADPLGVQLLRGEVPDWWQRRLVVISEGEPDWLSWASRQRAWDPEGSACFGISAGSWTEAIAACIPDWVGVVIRTHHDPAGDRYAKRIAATLLPRCRVVRSKQGAVR